MIALSVELARELVAEHGVGVVTKPLVKLSPALVNTAAGVAGPAAMPGFAAALAVPRVRLSSRRRRRA